MKGYKEAMGKTINICIIYDQLMVAEGMKAVLSDRKQFHVSYFTENSSHIDKTIWLMKIDVFIIELSNISKENIEYITNLRESFPKQKLIVVSGALSRVFLEAIINVVNGYLLRTCSLEKLVLAIGEVIENSNFLCSKLIPTLFEQDHKNYFNIDLTTREKEILSLLYTTNNNSEIADMLNISQTTVRTHLKNIRQKSSKSNQIQMMRYACNTNLLKKNSIPLCPNCRYFCRKNGN